MLIRDEADRIRGLVDRMEMFGEKPIPRDAVNIHRVLEHVRKLAQSGFAAHIRFQEAYDPSLPPVWGNRDQLVQVVLNLVKNAAEAVTDDNQPTRRSCCRPAFSTACASPCPAPPNGSTCRCMVAVRDNGPGIPEDIRPHLFEPFVTLARPPAAGLALRWLPRSWATMGA